MMKKTISIVLFILMVTGFNATGRDLAHYFDYTTALPEVSKVWTFDCDAQGWGQTNHPMAFQTTHLLAASTVNSGHLLLNTPEGQDNAWLFGPREPINADIFKYVHFSLSLENADSIPENGMNALFVFADEAGIITPAITFKLYKGLHNYTIDLSEESRWVGTKYINRFHFPQEILPEYDAQSAVYRLDWIYLSDSSTAISPVQDTTQACIPRVPELSTEMEPVVFCNRVSVKSSYMGSRVQASFKCWAENTTDTITQTHSMEEEGTLYFSTYDLELNTTYNYLIEVTNSLGTAQSATRQFTTEGTRAEDQPMNYWMTPSPFKLAENANEHLLDDDSWPEAGELAQVYKIHGATYRGGANTEFYRYDFPKLIFTLNKHRMRLAFEKIIAGPGTGEQYANQIIGYIEQLAAYGGKAEFHTWDGMMFRNFYNSSTKTIFRTPEEGLEVVAEATRIVKEKYPYFESIPLPNLPNWDVRDADGNILSHNAGNWAQKTGVAAWNDICDIYLEKIAAKGIKINYIEIDHPYRYYYKDGKELAEKRIKAIKDYCSANNLELIIIVNQSSVGSGDLASQDTAFKHGCLNYLDDLREAGIDPTHIDVESWYRWPQYLVPETKENSFTNVIRDVGKKFLFAGRIALSSQDNVSEIKGIGKTLQLFAEDSATGEAVLVDWSIDNSSIAFIDSTGLITALGLGSFTVTATLKSDSEIESGLNLTVVDNSIGINGYSYLEQIKVFPNPVNKKLSIEIPDNPASYLEGEMSLRWIDITGKTLDIESSLHSGMNIISLEGFSRGVYFIQIGSEGRSKLFKIIKH